MQHVISEGQIDERLAVRVTAEILVVVSTKAVAEPVMMIEHRRDPVETEPIKLILVHVPAQIRQEKTQYLPPREREQRRILRLILWILYWL